MEPRIQYEKTSEGVNIAYCVAGEGRNLLWVWPPPFSHVQLDWETVSSHIFQPLAKNQRLVWFDWPGTVGDGALLNRMSTNVKNWFTALFTCAEYAMWRREKRDRVNESPALHP